MRPTQQNPSGATAGDAEYASTIGAATIVIGAPTRGGLPALMDASASQELWQHTRSNIVIINPDAPMASTRLRPPGLRRPGRRTFRDGVAGALGLRSRAWGLEVRCPWCCWTGRRNSPR